jgi:glycosyltransferase involved in cell wall biosynthesis
MRPLLADASAATDLATAPVTGWIGNATGADHLANMTAQAEALNVPFSPHFRIPDSAIVAILYRASAMVHPSRPESFGLATIEAGTRGARVVAGAVSRLFVDPVPTRRVGVAGRNDDANRWSLKAANDRVGRGLLRSLRS